MKKINSTRKKGFTIVELVVAMAVIVIVSTTAISLVGFQNRNYLRTTQTLTATNMAENAIECFRWAVDNAEATDNDLEKKFYDAFVMTGCLDTEKYPKGEENNQNVYYSYEIEANGMTIEIKLTEKTETIDENDVTTHTLTFKAVAKEGNKVILQRGYTR